MSTPKNKIPEDVLDQLLAGIEHPRELLGPEGLVRQLTGRLVERSLEAELSEHLGYEKRGTRLGTNTPAMAAVPRRC